MTACSGKKQAKLPAPSHNPESPFGVDLNINVETIDNYLERDDVVYRDMRMPFDPADFASIGGNPVLSGTVKGFRIVPYPYLATVPPLPVEGAYTGNSLYNITWDENGNIASAIPNYIESQKILEDLFPKNKVIFLMCGAGRYAGMTKELLTYLGWYANKIYNIGGNWFYKGKNVVDFTENVNGTDTIATWLADYAYIDFSHLHKK
jgi:rhodanese-related sulfurtransferase